MAELGIVLSCVSNQKMYSGLRTNHSSTNKFAQRNVLTKLTQELRFEHAVKGLGPGNAYLLCRFGDVQEGNAYKVQGDVATDHHLV